MTEFKLIQFRQQRSFGEIFNATFAFFRQNFKKMFKTVLFICGPFFLVGSLLMGTFMYRMFSIKPGTIPRVGGGSTLALFIGELILMSALILFVSVVNKYIVLYVKRGNNDFTVKEVWNEAKGIFGRSFLLGIALGIVLTIAFVFLILPGIYLSVAFVFAFVIVAAEDEGILDAMSRSFNLSKGNWWSTFGLLFVMWIIMTAITYAFILPVYGVIGLVGFNHAGDPEKMMESMFSIYQIVMSVMLPFIYLIMMITYTIPMIALAFKYYSIVEEKEGTGLIDEIKNLEGGAVAE